MAAAPSNAVQNLIHDFEDFHKNHDGVPIFLLEAGPIDESTEETNNKLTLMIDNEYEVELQCPPDYPSHTDAFYLNTKSTSLSMWANSVNEFLLDSPQPLRIQTILRKAAELYHNDRVSTEDEMDVDDECGMDDDSAFTTDWELKIARLKKRWSHKEKMIREEKESGKMMHTMGRATAADNIQQIFTSSAASGILTNDLIDIMATCEETGISAEPIDDNIYNWRVKLSSFVDVLGRELEEGMKRWGYNYIELELDFALDLYPFYPPLLRVVRPRLASSLNQRVTNLDMLKLTFWEPTRSMRDVLTDVHKVLQKVARIDVASPRNDPVKYRYGAYHDIEHHLLKLAIVTEVNPRASAAVNDLPQATPKLSHSKQSNGGTKREEYWAAGTGYGHNKRPAWDIQAHVAAQKEKDRQIESVLISILKELKLLYANHAPQLKPKNAAKEKDSSVDPVEDMLHVLEGSALIPFLEQQLTAAKSVLEMGRHTAVYKAIVDVLKEISLQPALVPLLAKLPNQTQSIYELLKELEEKANVMLTHICKAGNGSIPKLKNVPKSNSPSLSNSRRPKKMKTSQRKVSSSETKGEDENTPEDQTLDEEKLARDFAALFNDVKEAFERVGIETTITRSSSSEESDKGEQNCEELYKSALKDCIFSSNDIELDGPNVHYNAKDFNRNPSPSSSQVVRIAQELTTLATSLPLELSSSIFVRSDEEKMSLMRALITGPENTPYAHGCFLFDIYLPHRYPKVPPVVTLQTTGGGTVRFNPNLYQCGKVCLSLLGTWEGQAGEQWNETTSTVLQVLVSIQSLILVPEPYFNEPGYEQEIGTEAGKKHSADYNLDVRVNTIKYAMLAHLAHPPPGFEDVIRAHFYLKKKRILKEVENWCQASPKSGKLERAVASLRTELEKLKAPASCKR